MRTRFLPVVALAALFTACTSSTEPTPIGRPTVVAGGYTMVTINGRNVSAINPFQYTFRAPGDTLDSYAQVTEGVACVSADGRFSFLRGIGVQHITRYGAFVDDGQQWGGFIDARGQATPIEGTTFRWDAIMRERPATMTARHSHDSLTVSIPSESATYLLIEAGAGSPMRDNCRLAGF